MKEISKAIEFFKQSGNSKIQEQFAEYHFLKDIILQAAMREEKLDVARSDFDAFGFDLFISRHGSIKKTLNIQLKATSGKCRVWDIHKSLVELENGRVILVILDTSKTDSSLISVKYLMFDRMHNKIALSSSPKVNHNLKCQIKLNQFKDITENILEIFD